MDGTREQEIEKEGNKSGRENETHHTNGQPDHTPNSVRLNEICSGQEKNLCT